MTNPLALPIDLNTKIITSTTTYYDGDYGEPSIQQEEEEEKSLGLIIAEQTATSLARSISTTGRFGTYGKDAVNLDKIITDQIEASVNSRVQELIDGQVLKAIIGQAQKVVDENTSKLNREEKRKHDRWGDNDEPFVPAEPERIETIERAVEIFIAEWANEIIEDKARSTYSNNVRDSRLGIKIREIFHPLVESSTKTYLIGLNKELQETHKRFFKEAMEDVREAATKALRDATSHLVVTLKDKD